MDCGSNNAHISHCELQHRALLTDGLWPMDCGSNNAHISHCELQHRQMNINYVIRPMIE